MTERTVTILGMTGGVGGAIGRALIAHGWHVRALVRSRNKAAADWPMHAPITWVEGDAMRRDAVIAAVEGATAIVHAVNPPAYQRWGELVLPMIDNTIAAARAAGGARIVLPGTIYNFDPAATPLLDEASPQQPRGEKGRIRVALERRLEDASADCPALVLRAGDFFGPDVRSSWFAQALVTPGKPVRRLIHPGRGVGHSWAYLPDLAEAFARLMDRADRLAAFERVQFGGVWDADGTVVPTAIRAAIGRDVPEYRFPWWLMRLLAPFGGFPAAVREIEPFWQHPVRLDNRRLVALIGEEPHTPLDAAVRETLVGLGCLSR
jgi:nucleoside-diphosphate-sugar epimerase